MKWITTLLKKNLVVSLVTVLAVGLVVASPVSAEDVTTVVPDDTFGLDAFETNTDLGTNDLVTTVADIIDVALGILGVIAVVIVLVGGFKWMTAGGNEDKVGEAKKTIFAGIIGLIIVLSAFAIARFVVDNLSEATGTGPGIDELPEETVGG